MTDIDKYTMDDLVKFTVDQKPTEFSSAFNELIMDKLHAAVQNKKMEVAKSIYNFEQESEEELDSEEETDGEES